MKKYNQCLLVCKNKNQLAWIEKQYAIVGLLITLEDEPKEDIWKVKNVYGECSMENLMLSRKTRKDMESKLK